MTVFHAHLEVQRRKSNPVKGMVYTHPERQLLGSSGWVAAAGTPSGFACAEKGMTEGAVISTAGLRAQVKVWKTQQDLCCSPCTTLANSLRAKSHVRTQQMLRAKCSSEIQYMLTVNGTAEV